MANPNAPHGFAPVGHLNGLPWNGVARMYRIPSSDGSAYAIGDLVFSATGSDAAGVTNVQLGTATCVPRGVIVGIVVAPTAQQYPVASQTPNLNIMNIPATKASDYYVMVVDDPFVIFEIMANNSTTITVTANRAKIVATPVTTQNISQMVLDSATMATTNTLMLTVLGMAQRVNLDKVSNTPLLVKFNVHELTTLTGTTGV